MILRTEDYLKHAYQVYSRYHLAGEEGNGFFQREENTWTEFEKGTCGYKQKAQSVGNNMAFLTNL